MNSKLSRIALGLCVAVLLLSPAVEADTVDVSIQGFAFNPQDLTVTHGTTVRWTNLDGPLHTSTSDDGVWDSGNLSTGQTFTFTFGPSGTYPYFCEIHPTMTATITVEDAVPSASIYALIILAAMLLIAGGYVLVKRGSSPATA